MLYMVGEITRLGKDMWGGKDMWDGENYGREVEWKGSRTLPERDRSRVNRLLFVSITKLHFFYALPQKAHFFLKVLHLLWHKNFHKNTLTSGWRLRVVGLIWHLLASRFLVIVQAFLPSYHIFPRFYVFLYSCIRLLRLVLPRFCSNENWPPSVRQS